MSLEKEIEKIIERKLDERNTDIQPLDYRPWIFTSDVAEILGYTEDWVIKKYAKNKVIVKKGLVKKQGGQWNYKHPEFLQYVHDKF